MKRIITAVVALVALGGAQVAPASTAPRALMPSAFDGSGEQTILYDYDNDQAGPILVFHQEFNWSRVDRGRSLRLPTRGSTTAEVPIQVHIVSTGGGTFSDLERGDVAYTCRADHTYRTAARLRARAVKTGWRLSLQVLRGLDPGPPACTDATAGEGFSWPTGYDWFVSRLQVGARVSRRPPRKLAVRVGRPEAARDCSDDPRIPLRCTETVHWSGRLQLKRR